MRRGDALAADAAERARAQVLLDRQLAEDAPAFGYLHHAGADDHGGVQSGQVAVAQPHRAARDRAAVQRQRARDRAHQRRLPGAVVAQDRDDLTLANRQ